MFCVGFIILGINYSSRGPPLSDLPWLPRLMFKTPRAHAPPDCMGYSGPCTRSILCPPGLGMRAFSPSRDAGKFLSFPSSLRGPSRLLRPEQVFLLCISLAPLFSTYHAPLRLPSHVPKSVTASVNFKRATHHCVHWLTHRAGAP